MSGGGYHNDDREDGPPRNVLSQDTIRQALARANSSQSENFSAPSRSGTGISQKSSSKSSKSSKSSSKASKNGHDDDCKCIDCRDVSYRDDLGTLRKDAKGDRVNEWDGDEAPPVHCHVQPGLFPEDNVKPSAPRRTNTGGSSHSSRSAKGDKTDRVYSKNQDGDLVEEWTGSDAPTMRAHYDWDAAEGGSKSGKAHKSKRSPESSSRQ